ncbi:MAG: fibronectin type III domain-containing protein [Eubacterium sp.]|nr:fibronectin type III domain-containing protein [Eubacterium sp.]
MKKRMLSAILAIVFALSAFLPFSAYAVTLPYVESDDYGNVTYHRYVSGVDTAFFTDYDEMVYQIRTALINHETEIEYCFATTDEQYAYSYEVGDDETVPQAVANSLYKKLFNDVFEVNYNSVTAGGGEYLFNSIKNVSMRDDDVCELGTTEINYYRSCFDTPVNGVQYYTFSFVIKNIQYETTLEQERMVDYFASWFISNYLDDNMTEYQRVKVIYDFIVRNTEYDQEVFDSGLEGSTTTVTPERYNIAHSAYGAIYGNILNMVEDGSIHNNIANVFASKPTVAEGITVPVTFNQGKAVCEGFSKLFYYLCSMCGIRAHIVDGDYIEDSGKNSDPHEWNYVYLKDEQSTDYAWYQVDCTAASENSVKDIDVNSYNYFLCGKENVYFGWKNHQQAYYNKGVHYKHQLYDWYDGVNENTQLDYRFSKVQMNSSNLETGYIICRNTVYDSSGEVHRLHILCDKNGKQIVEINEKGIKLTEVEGFVFNGCNSEFTVMLPYVVNRINIVTDSSGSTVHVSEGEFTSDKNNITNTSTGTKTSTAKAVGNYKLRVNGKGTSYIDLPFEIKALNMSDDAIADDSVVLAYNYANYTGNAIVPQITITDPYKNNLVENRDYTVSFIKNNQQISQIKDIGEYTIVITYKGNYSGTYHLDFLMDGIDLSQLSTSKRVYQYLPKYYRDKNNINNPVDYFVKMTGSGLNVGALTLKNNKDYRVSSSSTGLNYGSKGTIYLTGLADSQVKAGTKMVVPYEVSEKFDISSLNGSAADSNTVNKVYYTGSALKPTKFDWLNEYLEPGKDYKIVGYSNNVNVGDAYVKIQGIGGCTGTASLKFRINPKPQSNSTASYVKPTSSGNTIKLAKTTYVYNGKVNKPAVKFTNASGKAVSTYYYTVKYSGGKYVGNAYAVVKLRNGYCGSFKLPYKIKPKATKLRSVSTGRRTLTVKWYKQATQTTGYQLQYGTSSQYKGAKTVTVSKNSTVSKKLTGLKSKKLYYVRVRTYKTVGGKKYYSSWSKGLGIKVK